MFGKIARAYREGFHLFGHIICITMSISKQSIQSDHQQSSFLVEAFDGQLKKSQKICQCINSMNLDLFRYDYRVVETYFLKSIRSNQNEDHFYGVWNHRLLMATSKHSEDVDNAVLFLSGILSNFVTKWRQVINNQSEMIYSFDKNPILYLIKMTMIVGSFEMIDPANELITITIIISNEEGEKRNLEYSILLQKQSSPTYHSVSIMVLYIHVYFEIFANHYCSHCLIIANSNPAFTLESQDQCSDCYKIYNIADLVLGVRKTRESLKNLNISCNFALITEKNC